MSKTMCFLDMIDGGGGGGRLDLLTAGFSGLDVLVVGMVWQMLDDYLTLTAHHYCSSDIPYPF